MKGYTWSKIDGLPAHYYANPAAPRKSIEMPTSPPRPTRSALPITCMTCTDAGAFSAARSGAAARAGDRACHLPHPDADHRLRLHKGFAAALLFTRRRPPHLGIRPSLRSTHKQASELLRHNSGVKRRHEPATSKCRRRSLVQDF